MTRIIPTCVPQSFTELAQTIEKVREFAHEIHIDINDGVFAKPVTWPYREGVLTSCELPLTELSVHAHLMVEEPEVIGEDLAHAGVRGITAHAEVFASPDAFRAARELWKGAGAREVGIAILLPTPLEALAGFAQYADFIHVMSVREIGAQGAPFAPEALARIQKIREQFPACVIEADGGVSEANIALVNRAGATRCAVGSAIMEADDPARAYARLEALIR